MMLMQRMAVNLYGGTEKKVHSAWRKRENTKKEKL